MTTTSNICDPWCLVSEFGTDNIYLSHGGIGKCDPNNYVLTSNGSSNLPQWAELPKMTEILSLEQMERMRALMCHGYCYDTAYKSVMNKYPDGSNLKQPTNKEETKMSNKYYKVIKENFIYDVGAILASRSDCKYQPINNTDLWNRPETGTGDYIDDNLVEGNPDYFQRVYSVKYDGIEVFETKEKAKELFEKGNKKD